MDLENSPRFSIIEEPFYTQQLSRLVNDPILRDDIQQPEVAPSVWTEFLDT